MTELTGYNNWEDIEVDADNINVNNTDKTDNNGDIEDTHLNDIWSFHFHDPNNQDWNLTSYIRLHDVSTVQDFWKVNNNLKEKLKNGIFFLMREHIFPCWDDDNNVNGGCLSIKVLKENLPEYWEKLCIRILGENILIPELKDKWALVNGISTSPKRFFCIVKIWLKTNDLDDKKYYQLPTNYYGDIIYRNNIENIQKNNDGDTKHT